VARSSLLYRVTGAALGIVVAYCVFYLLPQSFILFAPYLGVSLPPSGGSALSRLQDLLIPALIVGVVYPLSLKTKYRWPISAVLGVAVAAFLSYAVEGGTMSITTLQTTSTGLQATVDTTLSFAPLLYLSFIPIAIFVVKSCYLSYIDFRGTAAAPTAS
jgi:hypothetical protein